MRFRSRGAQFRSSGRLASVEEGHARRNVSSLEESSAKSSEVMIPIIESAVQLPELLRISKSLQTSAAAIGLGLEHALYGSLTLANQKAQISCQHHYLLLLCQSLLVVECFDRSY
jgi:hypothetical protein